MQTYFDTRCANTPCSTKRRFRANGSPEAHIKQLMPRLTAVKFKANTSSAPATPSVADQKAAHAASKAANAKATSK